MARLRRLSPIIHEVEVNVKSRLSKDRKESQKRVTAYQSFSNAHTDYEEATSELLDLKETGSSKYLELMATRNIELSSLRHEAGLRKLILENYEIEHLPWTGTFQKLKESKELGAIAGLVDKVTGLFYIFKTAMSSYKSSHLRVYRCSRPLNLLCVKK